ncbi:hypothetical protein AAE478_005560 [Parahypoxylon ruwenzoriense]
MTPGLDGRHGIVESDLWGHYADKNPVLAPGVAVFTGLFGKLPSDDASTYGICSTDLSIVKPFCPDPAEVK